MKIKGKARSVLLINHFFLILFLFKVPGRPLFHLLREANTNQKISLDLSQDGKWLLSGGTDGKVQVWDVTEPAQPTTHYVVSYI